ESTNEVGTIALWIEPFLRSTATLSAEAAVVDAKAQGLIRDNAQVDSDCRTALLTVTRPMWRSRLLRLIADLSLTQLASDIEPLLQAPTSDERAASARALGRLGVKQAKPLLEPLLQDPVQDVRKAGQTALRSLGDKQVRTPPLPS